MKSYKVRIRGTSPYMQHRMDDLKFEEWLDSRGMIIENKDLNKTAEAKAEFHCYRNDNNVCYMPSFQIKAALIESGKLVKGKMGAATKSMKSIVAGMFVITPEQIPMTDYTHIDKRTAVNRINKTRVLTVRPKWDTGWTAEFIVNVKIDTLTDKTVKDIIQYAGEYIGLGSYRPTHNGEFGCYELLDFKEIKQSLKV